MRYESDSHESEHHAEPLEDVLQDRLREATSVQALEAASAPTTRPVLVMGQEPVTVPSRKSRKSSVHEWRPTTEAEST